MNNNNITPLENDDVIYERLVNMDQEWLVSEMINLVENDPTISLRDYLLGFNYDED